MNDLGINVEKRNEVCFFPGQSQPTVAGSARSSLHLAVATWSCWSCTMMALMCGMLKRSGLTWAVVDISVFHQSISFAMIFPLQLRWSLWYVTKIHDIFCHTYPGWMLVLLQWSISCHASLASNIWLQVERLSSVKCPRDMAKLCDADWAASDRPVLASVDGCVRLMDMEFTSGCSPLEEHQLTGKGWSVWQTSYRMLKQSSVFWFSRFFKINQC